VADVVIIGGGIAGPALAAALADTGLRIELVERDEGPLDTVRGDHLQPVTCTSLETWGVLPHLWALGAEKRLGSRWFGLGGREILHARVDDLDIPHPYFLYLNHELISRAFLERAASNPDFSLRRPATARLVAGDAAGHYAVEMRSAHGTETLHGALVVAADGRASRARRSLEIAAETHDYVNPMVVLFAARPEPDPRNEVRAWLTQRGIVSVIPRTGGGWKIGLPVQPSELNSWLQAGRVELARRMAAIAPGLAGIEPQVAGVYPIASVNATRWVKGNVVLLGDACHALHPGRSQGMNVALRAVERLSELLHGPEGAAALHEPRRLDELLGRFESGLKPAIDARLAENHAWGLEMDRMETSAVVAIEQSLSAIAADPEQRRAYCMRAAGY
jgi:2-polyprenyl-6-methoxyphenol hydroxylase-like FAD-dependent oxidoreductase